MSTTQLQALSELSYFGCGGTALGIHQPSTFAELQACCVELERAATPVFFLGGGSNSLISDEPYQGHVVTAAALTHISAAPGHGLRCGAGVSPDQVVAAALQHGLKGAAWLSGLPGQLGGAVRMNARCYGAEMAQIVHSVSTVARSGQVKEYAQPQSLFYGYKDTYFMQAGEFIGQVCLQLAPAAPAELSQEAELGQGYRQDRAAKGQYIWPTCGCVFKNNYSVGVPSGMLLELAGAKGCSHGGAHVSEHHSNFIYNQHATAVDILELSFQMRAMVYGYFGVWLEYEMEFLGTFAPQYAAAIVEQRALSEAAPHVERRRAARQHFAEKKKAAALSRQP